MVRAYNVLTHYWGCFAEVSHLFISSGTMEDELISYHKELRI